jgi:ParB-like chromosome segregation protein Spo0J
MRGIRKPIGGVAIAFEEATLRVPLSDIQPLREVPPTVRKSVKYAQIAASMLEIGIIEPPVVIRDASDETKFHLLDGHLRIDILRERGEPDAICLVATEDEAFTYNRRLNRIATVQEHKMILNVIIKGVSEERLARALNVNISNIRAKRNLLRGICPEVAELLKARHVPMNAFNELRRLKPIRQIGAAQLMVAMNRFSTSYAKSLVAATPDDELVEGRKKPARGLSDEQMDLMAQESESLDREFRLIEQAYGGDHLDLVLAMAYVARLLENVRVVRHLALHHQDILGEFQKMTDLRKAA